MSEVNIKYSDYLKDVIDEISFELLTDTILHLKYDQNNPSLMISMADKITDNTELHGHLDLEGVNVLIRALSIIRNQIKNSQINNNITIRGENNVSKSCK